MHVSRAQRSSLFTMARPCGRRAAMCLAGLLTVMLAAGLGCGGGKAVKPSDTAASAQAAPETVNRKQIDTSAAETNVLSGGFMAVTASRLNIRACPSLQCDVVTVAARGELVQALELRNTWVRVVHEKTGIQGWVSAEYLKDAPG